MIGHTLERVEHYPYLGVELGQDMTWSHHINKVTSKAQRALAFVRRNLSKTPQNIKEQMYYALVRPHLEYASAAWDPYTDNNIRSLEMVQRRAARFVTGEHSREPGTVTRILTELEWPSLQQRRKVKRLSLLHKGINNETAISIPPEIMKPSRMSRHSSNNTFLQPRTRTKTHQNSFFPRTITEWNRLPPDILEMKSADKFHQAVSTLQSTE